MVHTRPEQVLGLPYLPRVARETALTPKAKPGHLNDPKGELKGGGAVGSGSQRKEPSVGGR